MVLKRLSKSMALRYMMIGGRILKRAIINIAIKMLKITLNMSLGVATKHRQGRGEKINS